MRLIVSHRDFPFRRETRLARVVDITLLLLVAGLIVHAVQSVARPDPVPAEGTLDAHRQLVLTIHADGRWTLNGLLVPPDQTEAELRRVLAGREVKAVFIAVARGRPWSEARTAADHAEAAGARFVGFLPPPR